MIITIPNYSKWQKGTDKRRSWVALDVHFFDDTKVIMAMREDRDAILIYQWILMQVDQNGVLEIDEASLKANLKRALGIDGHNYHPLKRVDVLAKYNLIEVKNDAKEGLNSTETEVKQPLNKVETDVKQGLNHSETELKQCFKTPETHTALHARTIQYNTNNTIQIYKVHFNEFWQLWPNKKAKEATEKKYIGILKAKPDKHLEIMEGLRRYIANKPDWQDWMLPTTFLNQGRWADEYVQTGKNNTGTSKHSNVNQGHRPCGVIEI